MFASDGQGEELLCRYGGRPGQVYNQDHDHSGDGYGAKAERGEDATDSRPI
jgi:hypothetical protein